MSMHDEAMGSEVRKGQDDSGIQSLCAGHSRTGQLYLGKTSGAIDKAALTPGLLVYVSVRKLSIPLNGLDPVLFSAIDASTHLQVAQAYLSLTTAAALSFIEFTAKSMPFPLSQIRTSAQRPFGLSAESPTSRDFSSLVGRLGYVHSPIADPSGDALFCITSKLRFGGITEGSIVSASPQELQRDLVQFLLLHNNYRSIPWLDGKTPLQKLKTFGGYSNIHTFSPIEGGTGGKNDSEAGRASKARRH